MKAKKILAGRIEAGRLRRMESTYLLPEKKKVEIKSIEKFLETNLEEAAFEESIGVCLKGRTGGEKGTNFIGGSLFHDLQYDQNQPILDGCSGLSRGGFTSLPVRDSRSPLSDRKDR